MNNTAATEAITEPIHIVEADEEQVIQQALEVIEQARAITIANDEDYEAAGVFLLESVKAVRREINETFDPVVKAAHHAHKEAVAAKRKLTDPLDIAERVVKAAMGTYYQAQQAQIRKAEQQRLNAAREEAEARQLEEAVALEDGGHTEAAAAVLEQPVAPVVTAPVPKAPKAAGTSVQMVTKFRIIDAAQIDRKFLMPDEKKIRQIVSSFGADAAEMVGGIEVYEQPSVSARA